MMKTIKRVIYALGIIVIGLQMIFTIADKGRQWWRQNIDIADEEVQSELSRYLCNVIQCMDACEKNGIAIDSSLKEKIEEHTVKLLKIYREEGIDFSELVRLMYLNHHYDLGYDKELKKILGKYYLYEENIFTMYGSVVYEPGGWKERIRNGRSITIQNLQMLDLCGTYVKDYGIDVKLAKWFNSNVDRLVKEENKAYRKKYQWDFEGIFWYFAEKGELDRIEYKKMKKIIQKEAEESKKEIKQMRKKGEMDVFAFSEISFVSDYQKIFENDDSWENIKAEWLRKLDSEDKFCYGNEQYVNVSGLGFVRNETQYITENEIFRNNVNRWLGEEFERKTKEILINGTDFK